MSSPSDTEKRKKKLDSSHWKDFLILATILLVVLIIWSGGAWWIDTHVEGSDPIAARGQFGDKFGAINALFAGFAFAGIIFTIFLQNREIKQTKSMLEAQLQDSNKQRFDSTFFQLLTLHNDITSKLQDTHNSGRGAFLDFNVRITAQDPDFASFLALQKLEREEIRNLKDSRKVSEDTRKKLTDSEISNLETMLEKGVACIDNFLDDPLQEKKIKLAYTKAAELHIDKYSHYFRNLYHILLFIKDSTLIEDHERPRYAKFVRSQLSEPELFTIFYNSLTKIELPGREQMELGYPKMGKLLNEFDILQNLPPRSYLHPSHWRIFRANYKENS
jgi:hypothetical protein